MGKTKEQFVAVYVRTSKADGRQAKGEDSQIRHLKDFCRRNHLAPVKWYKDRISGASDKRPALDLLQKRVFEGKVSTIVTWKLDRLSRGGARAGLNLLADWLKRGIRVISTTEQFDFSGATGELIASVLFAVAGMYREALIQNTKRGLDAARARGVRLGAPVRLHAEDITPLLKAGASMAQAAAHLGCTVPGLYLALKREGITPMEARGQ
jgi:DNA invertase Pin-like site-specific DNA recombinase